MNTSATILTSETVKVVCRECGVSFYLEYPTLAKFVKVCPACSEAHAMQDQQKLIRQSSNHRTEQWLQICPPLFRDTIPHKLPNPLLLKRVLQWKFGPRGLILHSLTGTGKSRCAWLLLKREFIAGQSVAVMNSASGFEYTAAFQNGTQEISRWMAQRTNADILLLDDVFKVKLTESFEQALFSIFNTRNESQKPIIVTLNDDSNTLLSRMSGDRGEPMLRRLREFCTPLSFES